jgi:TRAP transporter TAXI family solute receptor
MNVPRHLNELSFRDILLIAVPVLLLVASGIWLAAVLIKPAPPSRVVLAAGPNGGAYLRYGEAYRRFLAAHQVDLEVRATRGSVENYTLLRSPDSGVDVALMQGGIGDAEEAPDLVALASVSTEPLWVFCRGDARLDRIPDLRGKRLAVGVPGSATRVLAEALLRANGLDQELAERIEIPGLDGAEALLRGLVDCQFLIGAPEAGIVKALSHAPSLTLMNFERAGAYTRHMHYLSQIQLPEGVIDIENDIPPRNVTLLAAPAQLVARDTLHPAIQDLLLMAATKVHGRGNLIQRNGEFPRPERVDFPVSDEAERFFRSGQSFLQRYLPFWLASLVDRFLIGLIPLAAVLIPLFRLLPPLYRWRVRSRIYRWYGELMFIENEMRARLTDDVLQDHRRRLENMAATVDGLTAPLAYADQLYLLRQHIAFVRQKLDAMSDTTPPSGAMQ